MRPISIAVIVEGDGEVQAVPVLVRRFGALLGVDQGIRIHPIRQPASKLLKPGELERIVELSARKLGGVGGVLLLLDSDDDCPAKLGPVLLDRVRKARPDLPASVVLAHREFEAWFLASASSIAGRRGLMNGLPDHPDPEAVRGCKEWLSKQMIPGRSYAEMDDQPAFTELFDIDLARGRCSSFDKCHRELVSLIQRVIDISPRA